MIMMANHAALDDSGMRRLSTGRCFVYLLPCREEDSVKIGYARDPWVRLLSFHPRFDRFFDLERGALVETDRVDEARRIEKSLKMAFADATTPAPLSVRRRAGGRFEWFRGVHSAAVTELQAASSRLGYAMHAPLAEWLRDQWMLQIDRIADWSRHEFELVEMLHHNAPSEIAAPRERALRERLEIWEGIGLEFRSRFPDQVVYWYQYGFTR
jgi:hypothetical protein